jgi:hypothetical protein
MARAMASLDTDMARLLVEHCKRISVADLFRKRLVEFDATSTGVCRGAGGQADRLVRWRAHLSESGSWLEVNGKRFPLVPVIQETKHGGVWWMVQGGDGKRYRHVLVLPSGQAGTLGDLVALYGLRYRSQRMWSKKSQRAYRRHKIIERLDGPTSFQWVKDHEAYVPKKPKLQRWTTYNRLWRKLFPENPGAEDLSKTLSS